MKSPHRKGDGFWMCVYYESEKQSLLFPLYFKTSEQITNPLQMRAHSLRFPRSAFIEARDIEGLNI